MALNPQFAVHRLPRLVMGGLALPVNKDATERTEPYRFLRCYVKFSVFLNPIRGQADFGRDAEGFWGNVNCSAVGTFQLWKVKIFNNVRGISWCASLLWNPRSDVV
jgi:hypothetical protein